MRLANTIAAAAVAAMTASTTMAGGLGPVVEDVVIVPVEPAPQRSSWGMILPILGVALLIGLANNKKDSTPCTPGVDDCPTGSSP